MGTLSLCATMSTMITLDSEAINNNLQRLQADLKEADISMYNWILKNSEEIIKDSNVVVCHASAEIPHFYRAMDEFSKIIDYRFSSKHLREFKYDLTGLGKEGKSVKTGVPSDMAPHYIPSIRIMRLVINLRDVRGNGK